MYIKSFNFSPDLCVWKSHTQHSIICKLLSLLFTQWLLIFWTTVIILNWTQLYFSACSAVSTLLVCSWSTTRDNQALTKDSLVRTKDTKRSFSIEKHRNESISTCEIASRRDTKTNLFWRQWTGECWLIRKFFSLFSDDKWFPEGQVNLELYI